VCGDTVDILGGRPTGSVRASLGYCSLRQDVDRLLEVLSRCFLETTPKEERKISTQNSEKARRPRLERLFLYPVKSAGRLEVQKWPLSGTGLVGDRCWMVVTSAGTFLSQKMEPRLCLIRPKLDLEANILTLTYPGMSFFPFLVHLKSF
jgi:molybdenum cofactor sulfurtransferase